MDQPQEDIVLVKAKLAKLEDEITEKKTEITEKKTEISAFVSKKAPATEEDLFNETPSFYQLLHSQLNTLKTELNTLNNQLTSLQEKENILLPLVTSLQNAKPVSPKPATILDPSSINPSVLAKENKLLFYTSFGNQRGCVTAFEKRRLVTFAHKMHQALRIGSEISIYSGQNNEKFRAIVVNRDDVRDFVILSTKEDVCDSPPRLHAPRLGEDYVQLGFSAVTQENSPLAVDTGVFTSIEYMPQSRHILGSAGSNPGDSGAGCFSPFSNVLFGINVANDSVEINEDTTLGVLGSRHPSRAHIVPSAFFV